MFDRAFKNILCCCTIGTNASLGRNCWGGGGLAPGFVASGCPHTAQNLFCLFLAAGARPLESLSRLALLAVLTRRGGGNTAASWAAEKLMSRQIQFETLPAKRPKAMETTARGMQSELKNIGTLLDKQIDRVTLIQCSGLHVSTRIKTGYNLNQLPLSGLKNRHSGNTTGVNTCMSAPISFFVSLGGSSGIDSWEGGASH